LRDLSDKSYRAESAEISTDVCNLIFSIYIYWIVYNQVTPPRLAPGEAERFY